MYTFIALLRGVNVSGQKQMRMEALRSLCEGLGLSNVQTYLQSGNVVFDSVESNAAQLARRIETQIEQVFGFAVPVLLRDGADFQRILTGNPFLNARNEDPAQLYVTFLYASPAQTQWDTLHTPTTGDEFIAGEREIFVFCPHGYGRTLLNNNFFEKKLKTIATTRNWNTVKALCEMAGR